MYIPAKKRFYTPQFSEAAAVSVRRLAWAMGANMVQAVDLMVSRLPSIVDARAVCQACKDNTKCQSCAFIADRTVVQGGIQCSVI